MLYRKYYARRNAPHGNRPHSASQLNITFSSSTGISLWSSSRLGKIKTPQAKVCERNTQINLRITAVVRALLQHRPVRIESSPAGLRLLRAGRAWRAAASRCASARVGLSPEDFFSSSLFRFSILRKRAFTRSNSEVVTMYSSRAGRIVAISSCAFCTRSGVGGCVEKTLRNAAGVPPLFGFNFFKETHESVRIIARFVHVLQAQEVGLASRRHA